MQGDIPGRGGPLGTIQDERQGFRTLALLCVQAIFRRTRGWNAAPGSPFRGGGGFALWGSGAEKDLSSFEVRCVRYQWSESPGSTRSARRTLNGRRANDSRAQLGTDPRAQFGTRSCRSASLQTSPAARHGYQWSRGSPLRHLASDGPPEADGSDAPQSDAPQSRARRAVSMVESDDVLQLAEISRTKSRRGDPRTRGINGRFLLRRTSPTSSVPRRSKDARTCYNHPIGASPFLVGQAHA